MGQNLRYLFGVGYPPKDVHRGTGVLTHCRIWMGAIGEAGRALHFGIFVAVSDLVL